MERLTKEERLVIRSLLIEHLWEYEKTLRIYSCSGIELPAIENIRIRIAELRSLIEKIESL